MGKGEVALGRWPTTIGGWKTIEKSDGSMALKYKESVVSPHVLRHAMRCGGDFGDGDSFTTLAQLPQFAG